MPRAATNSNIWFWRGKDWNRAYCHSNIKMWTIRYILLGAIPLPSFNIGGGTLNFVSHHCTCTIADVISDQICTIGKLGYPWNKKRYLKKKNVILLYFEKPFKWAYFLNDLFLPCMFRGRPFVPLSKVTYLRGYLIFHRKGLEPRVLPWQQQVGVILFLFGAKFEDHCSSIS